MTLNLIVSKTLRFLNKHSSAILSVGAGVGTIGAVIAVADATTKTMTAVQNKRNAELLAIVDRTQQQGRTPDMVKIVDLTNSDEYKLDTSEVLKIWALPVGLTIGSLTCIFFNHKINMSKQAALIAAAASTASMFNAYRSAVVNGAGTNVDEDAVKCVITTDPEYFRYTDDFSHWDISSDEIVTFYDENVGYFETTPFRVVVALYNLNQRLAYEGYITLTDFYDFLGVSPDHKHKKYCDTYGWDTDSVLDCNQSYFLHMQINQNLIGDDDDMTVYEFAPDFTPVLLEGTWF